MKSLSKNRLSVWLYGQVIDLVFLLRKIPAKATPPPFRLMQIGSLFWQSRALYVATRLGLADAIGDERKSVRKIAGELQLSEEHLYRLLRMLDSMGVFEEVLPRIFRNNPTSSFLRLENPQNVRAMILMHNSPEMTRPWMEPLEECIRDGGVPFERVHGANLFSHMDRNKAFDMLFADAMDVVDNLTGSAYLDDFDWSAFDRIIDIGGSKGAKSVSILKIAPGLESLVFDRPQVIEAAASHWEEREPRELTTRLSFQAGDMFDHLPAAVSDKDLYIFFAIFHGLGDDDAKRLLRNLRNAIGSYGARALIVDCVARESNIGPVVAGFDMQMLIGTRGRERTLSEWKALLAGAGFRISDIVAVRSFASFIVAELDRLD
ncbi:MAG: methyltransferase [Gammaproteobacteria bacterium]|jgi:hypothetical protein